MNIKYKSALLALLMTSTIYGNADAASIPSSALKYKGHYYEVYNYGLSWNEAEEVCEDMGGHLVTITSEGEQDFVTNLVMGRGDKAFYWLGGYKAENGMWRWITAEPPVYANWALGQPDNYMGAESVLMMYHYPQHRIRSGQWNDIGWGGNSGDSRTDLGLQNFGFICEWDNRR